jgi:hypothetical protein
VEPAGRNQQVIGGKRQKRKRTRKEVVKVPRKKREGSNAIQRLRRDKVKLGHRLELPRPDIR